MTSSIRKFWSQLDGSVHPLDRPIFLAAGEQHSFNLDFPPPAFIGDVDNAKVVILMASGGYNAETKLEFPSEDDHREYIDWLAGRRLKLPCNLSKYYTDKRMFHWIDKGQAVIINAIAYRSPKISEEPNNRAVGKRLPSYKAHLDWLEHELLPQAFRNERLVVAHRAGLWNIDKGKHSNNPNLIFSTNPVSPFLSANVIDKARRWMSGQSPLKGN